MSVKLKPVSQQVILITGASSGIGLITAQTAASMGAKVILVARNEEALDTAAADIINAGGEAIAVPADVADMEAFRAAAEKGVARFGRIDTWVNNAGVGMWARVTESSPEDDRRLFETNFWGVVNGSRLAVEHLRDAGGSIINVGSVVSDVTIPPQGMYSATKHAVAGFTDSLRIEIQHDKLPISVTLIKPAAIDTPFPQHARNYFQQEASLPPPVYDPSLVASAILFSAEHPRRDLHVGGGGRFMSMLQRELPGLADKIFGTEAMWAKNFSRNKAVQDPEGALHQTKSAGSVHGEAGEERMVRKFSGYNTVAQHPVVTGAIVTAAIAGLAAYLLLDHEREPDTWTRRLGRYGEDFRDRASSLSSSALTGAAHYGKAAAGYGKTAAGYGESLRERLSDYGEDVRDHAIAAATKLTGKAAALVGRKATRGWFG